jgi:Mg2+ and Co2+ transporter CorA
MTTRAYLYDAEGNDREVEITAELLRSAGRQQLLWIDVEERDPAKLEALAGKLRIDPETLVALGESADHRVENHGSFTHFALATAPATLAGNSESGGEGNGTHFGSTRLDFVVNADWLLTLHDGKIGFIEAFRAQDRPETMIGSLTTYSFAASLLDTHLEAFFEEIARIEAVVDRLDEQALTNPSSSTLLGRMVGLRRRVSRLRTLLSSQRGVFYALSRPDLQVVADSGAAGHFQVLSSRFERAMDEVEHTRDLVVGSFELFASRTAQQTNDLVKVLTYLTAVIGVCAAVAGVFGMNFETGFFGLADPGFYGTIAGLVVVVIAATIVARRRGWI